MAGRLKSFEIGQLVLVDDNYNERRSAEVYELASRLCWNTDGDPYYSIKNVNTGQFYSISPERLTPAETDWLGRVLEPRVQNPLVNWLEK